MVQVNPISRWIQAHRVVVTLTCLGFLVLVCSVAGCRTGPAKYARLHLTLPLEAFPPGITMLLSNGGPLVVRLRKPENAWGWDNVTVELRSRTNGRRYRLVRRLGEFSVNYPDWYYVTPGFVCRRPIQLQDGTWEVPPGLNLKRPDLEARICISVPATPEAEASGIFIGKVRSGWFPLPLKGSDSAPPP